MTASFPDSIGRILFIPSNLTSTAINSLSQILNKP